MDKQTCVSLVPHTKFIRFVFIWTSTTKEKKKRKWLWNVLVRNNCSYVVFDHDQHVTINTFICDPFDFLWLVYREAILRLAERAGTVAMGKRRKVSLD